MLLCDLARATVHIHVYCSSERGRDAGDTLHKIRGFKPITIAGSADFPQHAVTTDTPEISAHIISGETPWLSAQIRDVCGMSAPFQPIHCLRVIPFPQALFNKILRSSARVRIAQLTEYVLLRDKTNHIKSVPHGLILW